MKGKSVVSFRLGEYLVLPQHNKLIFRNDEYKVEPKIMQVLCYLISHKKEVVSRAHIAEEIWPGSVIGLEVVTRAIFELRKILKDDPKKPVYIETIARKGYCFIYDTSPVYDEKPHGKLSLRQTIGQALKPIPLFLSLVVGLSLLFMYQWFINDSDELTFPPSQVTLLTDTGIHATSPAISPDGKQVIFIRKNNFKESLNQLVLLDLATQKQTVINDGSEFRKPKWSKNNNYWHYIKCQTKTNCDVIQHEISTTKKQSLYKIEQPLFNFALSNDNTRLFLNMLVDSRMQLAQVNLDQIDSKILFIDSPADNNSLPTLSYDNKALYYVSTLRGGSSYLYQYDLTKRNTTLISDQFSRLRGLSLKDNKTLWLAGRLNREVGVWSLNTENNKINSAFKSLPGQIPSQITSQVEATNLIYQNTSKTINLESTGDFALTDLSNANSSMIDMNAVYAAKAKTLYFSSNRSGSYELWQFNRNEVEKLTNIQADMIERPIITLQGNKLAFIARTTSDTAMKIFDVATKTEVTTVTLPQKAFLLSWSNDQQSIYFSAEQSNQYNIYKLDINTSIIEKIILNAGAIAQESLDGHYLYYGDMLNGQLMRRTLLGEVDVMFKIPSSDLRGIIPHRIKVIDDGFYYISAKGRKSVLKYYSFEDKTLDDYLVLPSDIYVTDIIKNKSISVVYDRFSKGNSNLIELR
jgi:DNA-binding winged helix-turn-helix (wHTH) protein/Tol biopolymer transport system component